MEWDGKMSNRQIALIALIWVLLPLLAACATTAAEPSPTASPALQGTEWVLLSLGGDDLLEGTQITLRFGESALDGSAGCNSYGGGYIASEERLQVSDVYATEMACMEPAGVMDQEQGYLAALNAADSYELEDDRLLVFDASGAQILAFAAAGSAAAARATPSSDTATPTAATSATAMPSPGGATATPTPFAVSITVTSPAPEPPAGFKPYLDETTGVSLCVPESWTIVEPGPQGVVIILQSYPQDKYVGGEPFQPGDTKCDLRIHPQGVTVADLLAQTREDPMSTIVSEQEIVLRSGEMGTRIEVESLGPSLSLLAQVDARAIMLTCFGELEPFDQIAPTLGADD
jgi:heat shock protein HslJ